MITILAAALISDLRLPSPQRGEGLGVRGEAPSRTNATPNPEPAPYPAPQSQTQLTELQVAIRDAIQGRTSQNGYEEFLDAAVHAASPKLEQLYSRASRWGRIARKPDEVEAPSKPSKDQTELDLYRAIAREADPIYTLIERGSRKPVSFPMPLKLYARTPNSLPMLWAGEMLGFMAIVDFADGNGARGATRLLLALKFARQMQTGSTHHAFYGYVLETTILAIVDRHLFAHPIQFAEGVNALPDNLPMLRQAFEGEATMYRSAFLAYARDPGMFGESVEPKIRDAAAQIPPGRAAQIYDTHLTGLEDIVKWTQKRLDEPEKTWLELPKRQFEAPKLPEGVLTGAELTFTQSYLDQSAYVAQFLIRPETPFFSLMRMLAIQRVQQRILKHSAAVAAYKWRHGVLPANLAKVYGKEPLDPINDQPYRLTYFGDTIRVTLEVKGLGPISLTGQPPQLGGIGP